MLLRSFISIFLAALLFFVITIELVDLFSNLWRYVQNEATLSQILLVSWYYLPQCIGYSLAPALLFAISYTLGSLYASNELIAILGIGVPFSKLILPFLVLGLLFSGGYFVFHEEIIIDTYEKKTALQDTLLGRRKTLNNPNVTVIGEDGVSVYRANYYNDEKKTLSQLTILHRTENGELIERIECDWAEYLEEDDQWLLHNAAIYHPDLSVRLEPMFRDERFDAGPGFFQRRDKDMEALTVGEAREWLESLERSGRPTYRGALTEYYSRYAFALTPFIVSLISCGIGNRLRKNIVLMSLLASLVLSVMYYVADMVLGLFAKQGMIVPTVGAWGAVLVFLALGVVLLRFARTYRTPNGGVPTCILKRNIRTVRRGRGWGNWTFPTDRSKRRSTCPSVPMRP
jgi:lipopolysaccharide export system permease protein